MKVFNELIKSFDKIREYIRNFAIYGYKQREDFTHKSSRTYDNERRRIQSYLSYYVDEQTSSRGKRINIHFDSMYVEANPFFEVFKTKSFTKNDVMLHFVILDILSMHAKCSLSEIANLIFSDYLIYFNTDKSLDVRTIRIKLDEYISLGILGYEKDGKTGYYFLKDHILSKLPSATLEHLTEALLFFQNTLPLGILGNFILQKASHKSNIFAFRDLHFTHTLEDEIMLSLFCAIKNHNKILLVHPSLKENYVLPIKILDNIKQGRRYVIVYHYNANKYLFYRLDNIYKVNILEDIDPGFSTKLSIVNVLLENSWGVSFINPESPTLEKWVLTLHIDDQKEKYLLKQIEKENKEGTLNKLSKNTYLYTINVLDANEMAPWIRSFTGRILDIKCTNQEVLGRIIHDVKLMKSYYEEDDYGAI